MADLNASTLGAIIVDYLQDRDDVASVEVKPTDDATVFVADVTGQGGAGFLVTIVRLAEGGS